jgi:hypothetical protein
MKKNMRFIISILLMVLLSPIQGVYADGLSLKRVDNSVLKNLGNFNVTTIYPPHTPYRDILEQAEEINKNAFLTKVSEFSIRF